MASEVFAAREHEVSSVREHVVTGRGRTTIVRNALSNAENGEYPRARRRIEDELATYRTGNQPGSTAWRERVAAVGRASRQLEELDRKYGKG